MEKVLISIVGPTGIGKTALAIALAKHFDTEIVSADSRQFYKEMNIGTAVPSVDELASAPHHFIQHKHITENYTVGDFERDAIQLLDRLFQKHAVVVLVGGSALYMDAVEKGLDHFPKVSQKLREDLNDQFEKEGLSSLRRQLKELDPTYYESVDRNNPHRLIRALEVCLASGHPYSSFLNQKKTDRRFRTMTIGIKADRAVVYERIDLRVDKMVETGLVEEARSLYPYRNLNALQTVGYREIFAHMEGTFTLDFAISEIKKNTRRFAKRQLTWYRNRQDVLWVSHDKPFPKIIEKIQDRLNAIRKAKPIFYVMGVSGSGKSTIGKLLAERLDCVFLDGDDYHSEKNIAKMKAGNPLNDKDREEWLKSLNNLAILHHDRGAVIACSALKEQYRHTLKKDLGSAARFIYLEGSPEQIVQRLRKRKGHFMPVHLITSQFDDLEPPSDALIVSISGTPEEIVSQILKEQEAK